MTPLSLVLTAIGVASVLIGVLQVVIHESSLSPWQRGLVMASTLPVSGGLVWIVTTIPRTKALGRWIAAGIALRSVESAFAYANPVRHPGRVVGWDGTAALVVPVDSGVLMDAQLGVYNADRDKVGVVEVKQIERREAVCPVISRDREDFWLGLEEHMARDDSVPAGLHLRLENSEMARIATLEALQEWRTR